MTEPLASLTSYLRSVRTSVEGALRSASRLRQAPEGTVPAARLALLGSRLDQAAQQLAAQLQELQAAQQGRRIVTPPSEEQASEHRS